MKTNKLISAFIIIALLMFMNMPAHALNYSFSSGTDSGVFGKPTKTDATVSPDPMSENIRRNKDAAYVPPPYGLFSGDIPTEQSSLYHDNSQSVNTAGPSMSVTYTPVNTGGSISNGNGTDYGGMLPPTTVYSADSTNTLPLYYDDGSIGTLSIPKLKLTVKVYEGETLENMKNGLGHFEFTSAWDGNVGIAGHNRGVPSAIGAMKDLANGEKVIYTTKYGTRTYEIFDKQQIPDTDYSVLGWSETNILTVVTCVEGVPNLRRAIICREVRS